MTEEILIPKMKRLDKRQRRIKIPIINIALIFFCTLMIISATFLNVNIKHYIIPWDLFSNKSITADSFVSTYGIIPQIPIVMFVCAIIGKRMALMSVIIYIIAGLFFIPVFALGGGIKYMAEYGFGYILAYIPAVIIAGNLLRKQYSFKNMFLAALYGVLTIHITGIIYMTIVALFKHESGLFISGWISAQSGIKIVYDLIVSYVFILIGKYLHSGIKFIME